MSARRYALYSVFALTFLFLRWAQNVHTMADNSLRAFNASVSTLVIHRATTL